MLYAANQRRVDEESSQQQSRAPDTPTVQINSSLDFLISQDLTAFFLIQFYTRLLQISHININQPNLVLKIPDSYMNDQLSLIMIHFLHNIIQQLQMKNTNELICNLPLQLSKENKPKQQPQKNRDMPRQLPNDHYRVSYKQNICIKNEQINLLDGIVDFSNKKQLSVKRSSTKKIPRCNQNQLRSIIKKKLFSNGKDMPFIPEKKDEKKGYTRYHQLLSQFYGAPTQFSQKHKTNAKIRQNSQQPTFRRHQSAKSLIPTQKEQKMQKYRSQSTVKSPTHNPSKIFNFTEDKTNYLDLYMQKRKASLRL